MTDRALATASSSSAPPYLVTACVEHLTNRSTQYYNLIKTNASDGILWGVFSVPKKTMSFAGGSTTPPVVEVVSPSTSSIDCNPASNIITVTLKSASFLALSAMASSKAKALIQMFDRCDQDRQFVCWFTLEEEGTGRPLASKVLLVDVGVDSNEHDSSHTAHSRTAKLEQQNATTTKTESRFQEDITTTHVVPMSSTTSVASSGTSSSLQEKALAIKALKEDMSNFKQRRGGTPKATSNKIQGNVKRMERHLEVEHQTGSHSVGSDITESRKADIPRNSERVYDAQSSPNISGTVPSPSDNNNASYQHVLRLSVQIADSVARMGSALDEMSERLDRIEQEKDLDMRERMTNPDATQGTAGGTEKHSQLNEEMMAIITSQSERIARLEDQVASLLSHQNGVGYPAVNGLASAPHGTVSPPQCETSKRRLTAEECTPVPSFTKDGERNCIRSNIIPKADDEFADEKENLHACNVDKSEVRFSEKRTGQFTDFGQHKPSRSFSSPPKTTSSDVSLSEMIMAMEVKLGKIRTPSATPR